MINITSVFRSNKLREICANHNLTDPYRALYPNRKDYTFVPSAINSLNRSRIDMFLVKFPLIEHVKNCTISYGLLSAHFDHKCINLTLKKNGIKNYPVKIIF
jgi:exonuclease III